MRKRMIMTGAVAVSMVALVCGGLQGEEGLWLFNRPPRELLRQRYGFEPEPAWLERLQQACVRFNTGGSGSFVSPNGLVMTNHHVGSDQLQKLSTPERDLLAQGYHARKPEEELRCPDLELNVLMRIEDVTERVQSAVKRGMSPAEANAARRKAILEIEQEAHKRTGLRCDVVTLYHGAEYHLYYYKRYTDVRLVFAPEKEIAFFGGDPDNFEYPRYCLDICLFRVYENGQPVKPPHYLRIDREGCREGDLVFVAGHPGRTDRLNTVPHLQFLRDVQFPLSLQVIFRREVILRAFSERSLENARRVEDELFSYQNSRKARLGILAGLQDPAILSAKGRQEDDVAAQLRKLGKHDQAEQYEQARQRIAEIMRRQRQLYREYYLLERGVAFNSELFHIARTLVRLAEERQKPNAERLREYGEAGIPSLLQQLFSPAPIYDDVERLKLADSLSMLLEWLGADHEIVKLVLQNQAPQRRAEQLVSGTKCKEVAYRKQLEAGGVKAIAASEDPMIQLAKAVDPYARAVRKRYEEEIEEPLRQAYAVIAQARFAAYGTNIYPDATFTLRLSVGTVRGYTENGKAIPWCTTFRGAFAHEEAHQKREPFRLPLRWHQRREHLRMDTPFNFVCTNDIIGGNSGSPVVNRRGDFVGIIFDGNIHSLIWDIAYTDEQARAIAVHSAAIIEALEKVYQAHELLSELQAK
ncbi:MAG: S46 family peptidase [Gemmatales bacterium]|nr:S46 family peptidase [Gemmatales bacterium]MDW7993037.1 S46 family peptidase [Gemmatales bacterium]